MDPLLLSVADAALLIGFSRAAVQNWAYGRKCPPTGFPEPIKIGRLLKYRRSDIDRWVNGLGDNVAPIPVHTTVSTHARRGRGRPPKIQEARNGWPASLANFRVEQHQLRVFINGAHMREQSLVPTTLLDWPRVAELLPEQKLVYGLGFWAGRYTNSIGIAATPLRPLAASLGLDPTALDTGIKTLCDVQLLIADWERYEFFVRDWFRFHKFKGVGIVIAKQEFVKLASEILRNAVLEASPWLAEPPALPKKQTLTLPTATSASKSISAAAEKIRIRRPSGIVTYTDSDPDRAQEIEENYPSDLIKTAIEVVERRRKEPVPGLVMREIESTLKAKNQARSISEKSLENNSQTVAESIRFKDMKPLWNAIGMKGPNE